MSATPAPDGPVLRIEGLGFSWPGARDETLRLDHFAVDRAERVFVRGGSGCGKSTLLSLAAGVLLPTDGEVQLLGRSWRSLRGAQRDAWRAEHVGYVFQQFNLLPYLDVLQNVLLPCRFSRRRAVRCTGTTLAREAQRLLDALELEPALWQRRASELSVGQQQRVAAARALIGRPALVIADEPTSALDEGRRDAFMRLLLRECSVAGSALVFVSHDARLAAHFERVVDLPTLNRATQGAGS